MRTLSKVQFSVLFFSGLAIIGFLSNCGGVNSVYYDGRSCIEGATSSSTSVELYSLACSSCHNAITGPGGDGSAKQGASEARLDSAISSVASMKFLTCLTGAQRQSIISALNP